jgi:NAD(P)-dependent dehydrogenase (short-subunit alcohol dehydrogenase family)
LDIKGRVALITGAGVRVGRAIALGLAQQGADVAVHYNSSSAAAEEVVAAIHGMGRQAIALPADLGDMNDVISLIPRAADALGTVDVLINSASIFERGTLDSTTTENWSRHLDINLRAPFFLCQAFARQLPAGHRGHIINVADWRVARPGTQYMAYTLSKSALVTLTQSLALGLAPSIQVNALAPGAILPPPEDDGYFERLAERLPLKHTGKPQDIVDAVLYLLRSDFVTGEVLHITGGEHL